MELQLPQADFQVLLDFRHCAPSLRFPSRVNRLRYLDITIAFPVRTALSQEQDDQDGHDRDNAELEGEVSLTSSHKEVLAVSDVLALTGRVEHDLPGDLSFAGAAFCHVHSTNECGCTTYLPSTFQPCCLEEENNEEWASVEASDLFCAGGARNVMNERL